MSVFRASFNVREGRRTYPDNSTLAAAIVPLSPGEALAPRDRNESPKARKAAGKLFERSDHAGGLIGYALPK